MGESQRDIANALGMNESRMSVIVNSPLFQLELRKMQRRQEDRVADIYAGMVDNAQTTVRRHKELLDGYLSVKDEDGMEIKVPVGVNAIISTSSIALNAFLKLQKGAPAELEDGDEPYEARLEREVTFKETVTRKKGKKVTDEMRELDAALNATHPPSDVMDAEVDDVMDGMIAEGATA
jgi:hypothetical protein